MSGTGAGLHVVALAPSLLAAGVLVGAGGRHLPAVIGAALMTAAMAGVSVFGSMVPSVTWAVLLIATAMGCAAAQRVLPHRCAATWAWIDGAGLVVMAALLVTGGPHDAASHHGATDVLGAATAAAAGLHVVLCLVRAHRRATLRERVHDVAMAAATAAMIAANLL